VDNFAHLGHHRRHLAWTVADGLGTLQTAANADGARAVDLPGPPPSGDPTTALTSPPPSTSDTDICPDRAEDLEVWQQVWKVWQPAMPGPELTTTASESLTLAASS